MATTQPQEIASVTNPKTRLNYKKVKSEVLQLKKVPFVDKILVLTSEIRLYLNPLGVINKNAN
jgi:hypothetical protein